MSTRLRRPRKHNTCGRNITWHNGILTVRAEESIVCADIHVPGESKVWIENLLDYRNKHNIKHILVAGDFWNHDAVSSWELKDPKMNLKTEIEHGKAVLRALTEKAHVYLICGNHDERMPRVMKYALSFSDWMKTIHETNITVTDYDHLFLDSGGERIRVCHPDLYSKIKGNQVAALSQDLQEHVMMGHQHFASISTNKTGKYMCVDLPCLCDPSKFLYKRASTSRMPEWENGFVHVKMGQARLVTNQTF